MKYLAIACVFLALVSVFFARGFINRGKEIESLKGEKDNLINIIEGYKNAEMEANKSIKQLRKAIEDNKDNLDWYYQPIPFDLLNVMQERHNRNRKN